MELELIEVDCDGVRFGSFRHFPIPQILLKRQEIYQDKKQLKKSDGTYRHKSYHMPKITSTFKRKGSRRHQKQKDRRFFESQIDINNTLTPQREITNKVPDLGKIR
jgi:hypothetical protein